MSAFAAIAILLVSALPLALVGAIVAHALAQRRRRDEAWHRLAQRLGFVRQPHGASGLVDGVSVSAFEENRGTSKHPDIHLVVRARLEPQLDLGLRVRRDGFAGGFFEWLGVEAPDLIVGDPAFDQAFRVSGWEPERVRALLTPELRACLGETPAGSDAVLEDGSITLERRGFVDEAFVGGSVPRVAWLAHAVRRAADDVPPSPGLGHLAAAYAHAAGQLGLQALRTPLGMAGSFRGVRVWVLTRRHTAQGISTSLVAQLPASLSLALSVVPRRGGALAWLRGADIEVGSPGFDAAFDVRANDPRPVRALLTAARLAAIERLAHRGCFALDDHSVRLDVAGPLDPHDLVPLLVALTELARALSQARAT